LTEALEAIIGRAVIDREFRGKLLKDPAGVVAEYKLKQEDIDALRSLRDKLKDLIPKLDDCIAKMTVVIFCG